MRWIVLGISSLFVLFVCEQIAFWTQPWAPWWAQREGAEAPVATTARGPVIEDTRPPDTRQPDFDLNQPISSLAVPTPLAPTAGRFDPVELLAVASEWLNVRYDWGGCSKVTGVDCSCYVQNVLARFGIRAPRTTTEQIKWATPVSRATAQPGDLIFYDNTCTGCGANPTHVALYLGNGRVIHAGDPVHFSPAWTLGDNPRVGRPH